MQGMLLLDSGAGTAFPKTYMESQSLGRRNIALAENS